MVQVQRWLQILWLVVALVLVYSNYVHRGADSFGLALVLWSAVAVGTALFSLSARAGLLVSAISAMLVLLVVGPWSLRELLHGIPHGPRGEGNPLVIFQAVVYLVLAVLPALIALVFTWLNRLSFKPAPPTRGA